MQAGQATPYAVLRVDRRKAKAMAAIAASSAHQMRERDTLNADPDGEPPIVMHLAAGKTPYQAARHLLEGAERRNRETVLCREIVLSASASYFRPGREHVAGVHDPLRTQEWATAALAWAKRQWPDQLASFVVHADEITIHAHLLVVPRVKQHDGSWKLNSKSLFDRARLRELQTAYGHAMAPLGIRRGEPGSLATHTEAAQFYGATQAAKAAPVRAVPPPPPKPPTPPAQLSKRLMDRLMSAIGFETEHDRQTRTYQKALAHWRARVRAAKQKDAEEWERMKAMAAMQPLRVRAGPKPAAPTTPASVAPIKPAPSFARRGTPRV